VGDSSKCTIESVYDMLIRMVKNHACPLCGETIYGKYVEGSEVSYIFLFKHLPFVEDNGKAIVAGIICGNKGGQRLVLLKCVKGSGEDVTVPF